MSLITGNAFVSYVLQFLSFICTLLSGWGACVVIGRKWADWGLFVLLTQTGTVQRLWTAHRPLVCLLILDTHCNSGPTGLQ